METRILIVTAALIAALGPDAAASAAQRGIDRAIPAEATDALFVERIARDLAPSLDAFERAFGSEEAIAWADDAPLPALALQVLAGVRKEVMGIDPEGGLGLYRTPGFAGAIGVVAVVDVEAAERSLLEWFEHLGALSHRDASGAVVVKMPDGEEIRSLARGGYLYLAMPQEDPLWPGPVGDPASALPAEGRTLADDPLYRALRAGIRRGHTWMFLRRPLDDAFEVEAALLSFRVEEHAVSIDGRLAAPGHGWGRATPARSTPLDAGPLPGAAVLFASANLPADALVSLLAGRKGTERRAQAFESLEALGLPPDETLSALDGRGWVAFHLEAQRLADTLLEGEDGPVGGFDVELGTRLRSGERTWRGELGGEPLELRRRGDRLSLHSGATVSRPRFEAPLPARGSLRLAVDVQQLRTELEKPVDPPELNALIQAPFAQFYGIDRVLAALWGEGEHLRVRGEVRFVHPPTRINR